MNKLARKKRNKIDIRRIDWKIVKRLVTSLYYHSRMKKTQIATTCNLSYDKCRRYLCWMEIMDLINKDKNEEGFELIRLTEKGNDLYNKEFKEN